MKLAEWARKQGIDGQTAYKWFHENKLPVPAIQLPTGTILVQENQPQQENLKTVAYCRVSSQDQKEDLERQLGRVVSKATEKGHTVHLTISEIGSAMNNNRPKLKKILSDPSINIIIVEHRDRLTRFAFELLESSLKAQNRKIIVLEENDIEDDLVRDMTEILTSFCARLYGKRSAKNKAERAIRTLKEGKPNG